MYKIKYLKTGHIFVLPKEEALNLKIKSPDEYLILEKNGKKYKDKVSRNEIVESFSGSILPLVLDN